MSILSKEEKKLKPPATRFEAWIRLIRLPNSLTVIGDPVAGYFIAGGMAAFDFSMTAAAVIIAYIVGLITNDIADFQEDLKERPFRSLPSGMISRRAAAIAALVLTGIALGLTAAVSAATLTVCLLLFGLIFAYNFILKSRPLTGATSMMLCRVTGVLIGVVAAAGFSDFNAEPVLLFPFMTYFFYIFGLSRLACDELIIKPKVAGRYGVLIGTTVPMASFIYLTADESYKNGPESIFLMVLAIVILLIGFRIFIVMSAPFRTPKMIQESVREIIGILPLFQAGWVLLSGHPQAVWYAAGLCTLSLFFSFFSRRIAAT